MLFITEGKDEIINCEKFIRIKFFKMVKDGSEINLVAEFDKHLLSKKIKFDAPNIIMGEKEVKTDIKKISSFFEKLLKEKYVYEEEIPHMLLKYLEEVE